MSPKTKEQVVPAIENEEVIELIKDFKPQAKKSFQSFRYMVLCTGLGDIGEPGDYDYDQSEGHIDRFDKAKIAAEIKSLGGKATLNGVEYRLHIGKERDRFKNGRPVAGWAVMFDA